MSQPMPEPTPTTEPEMLETVEPKPALKAPVHHYYNRQGNNGTEKPYIFNKERPGQAIHGSMIRSGNRRADLADLVVMAGSEPWMRDAACATAGHPEAWFPDIGGPSHESAYAIRVCRACPVQTACLSYALEPPHPMGIWGGLTAMQRRHLNHHPDLA